MSSVPSHTVSVSGTWVRMVDALDGFDLDHDCRLAVRVLMDDFGGIAGEGRDARDEAVGRGRGS